MNGYTPLCIRFFRLRETFFPISSSFVTGNRFHVHVCVCACARNGNKWCNWRGPLSSRVQTLIVNEIYDTCIIKASCFCCCFRSVLTYERAHIFICVWTFFFLLSLFLCTYFCFKIFFFSVASIELVYFHLFSITCGIIFFCVIVYITDRSERLFAREGNY